MAKRYIITIPVRVKSGWGETQVGEVYKTLPALKKGIPAARALSPHGAVTVWTMSYDSYGNKKELIETTMNNGGKVISERDRTRSIHITPREVPNFPELD